MSSKLNRLPDVTTKLDDRCAICELVKPLTKDHVFPKVALETLDVSIHAIYPFQGKNPGSRYSQNGVRFETLCGDCNSKLGGEYDDHLGNLVKKVRTWDRVSRAAEDRLRVDDVDTERVILSVFGHILAASSAHPEMVPDVRMREALRAGKVLPDSPRVFYWLAKYGFPTILRGIVRARFGVSRMPMLSVLKCPPVGFLAADADSFDDLPHLLVGVPEVRFWPRLVRHEHWPEQPDDDGFIMTGATALDGRIARPRL